jgi:predicted dehydrogenase
MSKIGVGVIGVGAFGEEHVAAYRTLYDVEVVAISDTRESRLQEIASKYGVPNCYSDYKELCARKDIDLVSVVTPEAYHLDPVLAAAREGKHVLLEKPIATSVEDAKQIIEAAANAQVYLMVGHILRFENTYGTVKREIEEGNLGSLVSIHARRNRPKKIYETYSRVCPILLNSIHDIDLCLWYLQDRVKNVRAFTRNIQGGSNPDLNWSFLEFQNGAVACLETHWLIPDRAGIMTNDALQVIGTKGVADIHFVPSALSLWKEDGCESANVTYDAWFNNRVWGAIKEEVSYFVDCVRKREPPTAIKPQEALEALKVALALIRSSKEQRDVSLA